MLDELKRSKLLLRLQADISAAKSPLAVDCKRLERAIYLIRLGHVEAVRGDLEALRSKYRHSASASISAWLHLAEGMVEHFTRMAPQARDKFLRANVISAVGGLDELKALSAAWLAHIDYTQDQFESMVKYATEALDSPRGSNDAATARASLVLAQAWHFCDRLEQALPWYRKANRLASTIGDTATTSAVMHNMAWLRAQRLLAADCGLAPPPAAEDRHALLSIESTQHLDSMIGSKVFTQSTSILHAYGLTLTKRFAEALPIYAASIAGAVDAGLGSMHAEMLANQAWCHAQLGHASQAREDSALAEARLGPVDHVDDRALAHARLAQVFESLGEDARSREHRSAAEKAFRAWQQLQSNALEALGRAVVSA